MPTTITSLVILLIAVVPGALGNAVFTRVLGVDWRERESAGLLRMLAFSVLGLMIYAWIASLTGLPAPDHALPSTYISNEFGSGVLGGIAVGYLGHTLASGMAGGGAAVGSRLLARAARRSAHPAAWDEFVADHVENRWVVVTLVSGEAFCGILETADASVDASERDVLLREPATYEASKEDYIATEYRHLFLRATEIDSVASVRDPDLDTKLITKPREPLFRRDGDPNGQKSETSQRADCQAAAADPATQEPS